MLRLCHSLVEIETHRERLNSMYGEWINEFERQSLNGRNPSFLEPQLVENVSAARDSLYINPLTFKGGPQVA